MADEVEIRFTVDSGKAKRALKSIERAVDDVGDEAKDSQSAISKLGSVGARGLGSLTTAAVALTAAVAALAAVGFGAFVSASIDAASAAEETQNLFEVSFGEMAGAAEEWAQRTAAAIGVNDTTLKQFGGTLANITSSLGLTRDASFQMSTVLTELAFDLSSLQNVPFEQAFGALRSGIIGQTEPLTSLGINILDNNIKQTEFAQSILATGRQLTEQEKIIARFVSIIEQSETAQGDLIRTQDSWTNATRILGEAFTGLLEEFGTIIVESRTLGSAILLTQDVLRGLTEIVIRNKDSWRDFLENAIQAVAIAIPPLISITGSLVSALGTLGKAVSNVRLFWVNLIETLVKVSTFLPGLIPGLDGVRSGLVTFAEAQRTSVEQGLELSIALERGGEDLKRFGENAKISVKEFVDSLNGQSDATDEIVDGTERYTNALDELLTSFKSTSEGAALTTKELKTQQKEIDKARELFVRYSGAFGAIPTGVIEVNTSAIIDQAAAIRMAHDELEPYLVLAREKFPEVESAVKPVTDEYLRQAGVLENDLKPGMSGFNDFLSTTRGILGLLGIDTDNFFGKFLGGLQKGIDLLKGLGGLLGGIGSLFGGRGGGGGLGGLLGGLFGGGGGGIDAGAVPLGIPASALGAAGTTAGTGFLASFGSTVSSGLSSLAGTLGPLFTNPFTAIIGAGIAGFFGIKALFGGSSNFEKVGEEAGAAFGEGLSEGVQFGIVNLFEGRGGTIGQAIQLSLGEVIKDVTADGVANFDLLAEKISDTFSFLERGEITAAEAQNSLNASVSALLPFLDQLGTEGVAQLERLIASSELFGVTFTGIDEVVAFLGNRIATELPSQVATGVNSSIGSLDRLRSAARSINIPSFEGGREVFAQSGIRSSVFTSPTRLNVAEAGRAERVTVTPIGANVPSGGTGNARGGDTFNITTGSVLGTTEQLEAAIFRAVDQAKANGRLKNFD